jgi:hypothetical protein
MTSYWKTSFFAPCLILGQQGAASTFDSRDGFLNASA